MLTLIISLGLLPLVQVTAMPSEMSEPSVTLIHPHYKWCRQNVCVKGMAFLFRIKEVHLSNIVSCNTDYSCLPLHPPSKWRCRYSMWYCLQIFSNAL